MLDALLDAPQPLEVGVFHQSQQEVVRHLDETIHGVVEYLIRLHTGR